MPVYVVVGGFYGDEGKGKVLSYLALKDDADLGVRGGVGPNAGHTVVHNGREYKLRQIPSAFVNKGALLLIGPGVLVNPEVFLSEVSSTGTEGRIFLDRHCGIIEPEHIQADQRSKHLQGKVGTTGTGTGPANADRALRRLKLAKDIPCLAKYLEDVPLLVNEAIDSGKNVLIEGTQGTFLSLWHTDHYPYCTSKDTTASAICSDVGVGPKKVDEIVVVFKSYVTRVGGGPLEGEYSVEEAKRRGLYEVATVTGRVRRAAPFNFKLARRAVMLNSATQIALTKLDVLFPEVKGATKPDALTREARDFIERIEEEVGIPVTLISTGPGSLHMIDLRKEKL